MEVKKEMTERAIDRIDAVMIFRGVPVRARRKAIAEVCGITPEAVRQWYTKGKDVDPRHLSCIARKWQISPEWLKTGVGDMIEDEWIREPAVTYHTKVKDEVLDRLDDVKARISQLERAVDLVEALQPHLNEMSDVELDKLIDFIEFIKRQKS